MSSRSSTLRQPGDRGLGLVEDLGELRHRLEEQVDEEDEGDDLAGGQAGVGAEGDAGHDRPRRR
jgi:hypothetical protein